MGVESKTKSGRLLYVVPDIEWYIAGDLERGYAFTPAFRDSVGMAGNNPSDNYGRGSMEFAAYLRGREGAVQFKAFVGLNVEDAEDYLSTIDQRGSAMPADLGYHSPTPRYEGQSVMSDDCSILGGPCYYDGSTLNADPVWKRWIIEGMPGVWDELWSYYQSVFPVAKERGL